MFLRTFMRLHLRLNGAHIRMVLARHNFDAAETAMAHTLRQRGRTMADEWPLGSYLELGALPGAVACARLHTRQVLWEWGLWSFSENAELAVSELVTNAVRASQSAGWILPVRLWLSSDRSRLLIEVEDTSRALPSQTAAGDDDERGRGLLIVDAVSAKWGWDIKDDHGGKTVWALLE